MLGAIVHNKKFEDGEQIDCFIKSRTHIIFLMQGSPGVLEWHAGAFFGLSVKKKIDLTDN